MGTSYEHNGEKKETEKNDFKEIESKTSMESPEPNLSDSPSQYIPSSLPPSLSGENLEGTKRHFSILPILVHVMPITVTIPPFFFVAIFRASEINTRFPFEAAVIPILFLAGFLLTTLSSAWIFVKAGLPGDGFFWGFSHVILAILQPLFWSALFFMNAVAEITSGQRSTPFLLAEPSANQAVADLSSVATTFLLATSASSFLWSIMIIWISILKLRDFDKNNP